MNFFVQGVYGTCKSHEKLNFGLNHGKVMEFIKK